MRTIENENSDWKELRKKKHKKKLEKGGISKKGINKQKMQDREKKIIIK